MSTDINAVLIVGRLTRDVAMKTLPSGTTIAEFSIANGQSRKEGDEWQERAYFFDCVLIGKRAAALAKYLVKGKQLAIRGTLQQDRWEKDGVKHSRVKILVDDIQLLGGGRDSEKQAEYGTQPGDLGVGDDGEDVPF